jgi:hypothetical protein
MLSPATIEAEVAPIWGHEDDAMTNESIGAVAAVPTATVMPGAGAGDPSPVATLGASGAVALAVAASPRVGAPPICATCGLYPAAPPCA